jgi:hypothetical protein
LAGCTVTAQSGKITYSFHFNSVTRPAVDAPTVVKFSASATCSTGEVILAGGYNLNVSNGMDEWLAAHPAPKEAQPDQYGLYRPIPPLLRVIANGPALNLTGWSVTVEGMLYPSEGARSILVYAYCAAGLSLQPSVQSATITTTKAVQHVDAPCPAGTLASGGGYTSGTYSYAGGTKSAYLPVYRSLFNQNGWQVGTDDFFRTMPSGSPTFDPYPSAKLTATAVCVGTNDFARVPTSGPELIVSPATPELHMLTVPVGNDTDYRGQYTQPTPCPAGALLLPPSYDVHFAPSSSQDLRVDAVWVDNSLAKWTVAVSTGGASTYTSGTPLLSVYATCLTPK